MAIELRTIYFAGGCFWGTEHLFKQMHGVVNTQVGFANGHTEQPTYKEVYTDKTGYAETVKVVYDPMRVDLSTLLEMFFLAIDPTSHNKQGEDVGTRYRTGIYYTTREDFIFITPFVEEQQRHYDKKLAVEVRPLEVFYPAEEYHQDYLDKNVDGYCHLPFALFRYARDVHRLTDGPRIRNVIFDYGKVLVDYSLNYLYDSYFEDKEEQKWFFDHVVNAEFHTKLDLGTPTAECVEEWKLRFPKYARLLDAYNSDYMKLMGEEIPGMSQLLTELRHYGIRLYGLTNWGIEKFCHVREKYSIFDLLDGEVVSGVEHVVKPDAAIFQILLNRYDLNPEECLFTDDRAENVAAACEMGMQGVVFESAQQLKAALMERHVL